MTQDHVDDCAAATATTGPETATELSPRAGRLTSLRRHRRGLVLLVLGALLAEMAVAMVTAAVQQTPTTDEPVYVGTAVVYLQQHSLRYNAEHPPLGKLIIGVGLAFARPRLDPAFVGDHWALGQRVLYDSGNDPGRLMLLARLPVILLTLLFGLAVFAFARDLAGPAGGLVALALYAFSPDVIAHGSLATLDVPAAGFLVTALWLAWRARRRPGRYLPLAGLVLGAALATRMSVLPAVPVLLVAVVLAVWHADRSRRTLRLVARGVLAAFGVGVIAVAVVWASYLAVDPRLAWVTPPDVPVLHGLRALAVDWLPFPRPYRDGMRIQLGFEDDTFDGFLFGRQYQGSLWYYLPAALLVKTPLGALALWLSGAASMLAVRRLRPAVPFVLLPALVLLLAALPGARDFGVRYVIILPMLLPVAAATVVVIRPRRVHVAAGARLPASAASWARRNHLATVAPGQVSVALRARRVHLASAALRQVSVALSARRVHLASAALRQVAVALSARRVHLATAALRQVSVALCGRRAHLATAVLRQVSVALWGRRVHLATGVLLAFVGISSIRTFPYYLPYSNEAFGGPGKTYLWLHDSNVDWGQDLGRLADRLREDYRGETVWLVYKGNGDPDYYGIVAGDPRTVPAAQVRGVLVVSDDAIDKADAQLKSLIATSRPVGEVGHSITIFRR